MGLQTVISRQTNISATPSVVSIGTINGGTRYNIIPESVDMAGTIRSYDFDVRRGSNAKVRAMLEKTAEASGPGPRSPSSRSTIRPSTTRP